MTYKDLLSYYGSGAKAADTLGLSRQGVHKWKTKGIPFEQQYRIQLATRGRLKAQFPSL